MHNHSQRTHFSYTPHFNRGTWQISAELRRGGSLKYGLVYWSMVYGSVLYTDSQGVFFPESSGHIIPRSFLDADDWPHLHPIQSRPTLGLAGLAFILTRQWWYQQGPGP
jgi:hypothetical protein